MCEGFVTRPEIAGHNCDLKLKGIVTLLRSENTQLKTRIALIEADLAQARRDAAAN